MKNATKFIAAYALLTGATGSFAQISAPAEPRNIVQLSSSGAVDVQQDLLTLTLSSTKDGADAGQVQAQLRQALDAALTEAKKSAQPGAMDVRTGAFSLQPRYGREGKVNGWVGVAELVLEGRDFGRMGAAAGRISGLISGLTISNATFSLSRELRNKVEAEAQDQAVERFKTKANDIARSFGFSGYVLRDVSVSSADQGYNPRPRMVAMEMKAMSADAPVPMEGGKSAVVVQMNGSVQLK
jgi:predicted secreted protein